LIQDTIASIVPNKSLAAILEDIVSSFLLGGDGALYEGRGFTREGPNYTSAIDKEYTLSGQSIEVAFIDKCSEYITLEHCLPSIIYTLYNIKC
jgi:hypothetical protein